MFKSSFSFYVHFLFLSPYSAAAVAVMTNQLKSWMLLKSMDHLIHLILQLTMFTI